jgi:hypothetical protein
LHPGVWAIAVWDSAQIATRAAKSLILIPSLANGIGHEMPELQKRTTIIQSNQSVCQISWAKCTYSQEVSIDDCRRERCRGQAEGAGVIGSVIVQPRSVPGGFIPRSRDTYEVRP